VSGLRKHEALHPVRNMPSRFWCLGARNGIWFSAREGNFLFPTTSRLSLLYTEYQ
jgi:hypothetical protein